MKKQYISPEVLCHQIHLDNLLGSSITSVDKGDLEHDMEVGEDAEDGASSDSRRRRDIWEDEELEEEEFEY